MTEIRAGHWERRNTFHLRIAQETAGAWAEVTTSKAKTDTPTSSLTADDRCENLHSGYINRIHYRLNFVNVVTFTLRFWRRATAGDYESNMDMLWESDPLQADDEDYDQTELNIPFELKELAKMYFSVEWTGACGNIQGFIEVSGEMID